MKSQLEKIIERLRSIVNSFERIRVAVSLAKLGHYREANRTISLP